MKPLEGVRVLEIASIGPGPLAANTFLELGAEVIRVNNPKAVDMLPSNADPALKNRINITVDLKSNDGIKLVKENKKFELKFNHLEKIKYKEAYKQKTNQVLVSSNAAQKI